MSEFESDYENSEVDSSAAPSDVDSSPGIPSADHIVPAEISADGRLHLQFARDEGNTLSIKIVKMEFVAHQKWRQEDLGMSNPMFGLESACKNSEVDGSAAPSDVDRSPVIPSAIHIFPKGTTLADYAEIGAGGRLHLQFTRNKGNKLSIKIVKMEFAAHQKWRQEDLEVSCMLLPMHKQSFHRRSQRFGEVITVQLPAKTEGSSLRLRIYDHKTITKKYLIGQGVVSLKNVNLEEGEVSIVLDLTSPNTYGIDSRYIGGIKSAQPPLSEEEEGKPEILVSFEYRALTRKLVVEVVKTRNLGMWLGTKPQDLCVSLFLKDENGRVMRTCRTSVKHHVIDLETNEMFMFRLNMESLEKVSLKFCVTHVSDVRKKEEVVGHCSFGLEANTGEQAEHWGSMMREAIEGGKGAAKCEYKWHPLFK